MGVFCPQWRSLAIPSGMASGGHLQPPCTRRDCARRPKFGAVPRKSPHQHRMHNSGVTSIAIFVSRSSIHHSWSPFAFASLGDVNKGLFHLLLHLLVLGGLDKRELLALGGHDLSGTQRAHTHSNNTPQPGWEEGVGSLLRNRTWLLRYRTRPILASGTDAVGRWVICVGSVS